MKINPQLVTSTPSTYAAKPEIAATSPGPVTLASGDTLRTPNLETLRAALLAEPEVRPDQVVRAQAWISDPNYPPLDVLNGIATSFVADALRYYVRP